MMIMKNILENMKSNLGRNGARSSSVNRQSRNNLHSSDHFRQRLLIEKRRAERLNTITSVIVVDISRYLNAWNGRAAYYTPGIDALVKSICSMLRETDVVTLDEENMILILLPDTDTVVARSVYERLTQRLNKFRQAYSRTEEFNLDEIEMEILSYSGNSIDEQAPTNGIVMHAKAGRALKKSSAKRNSNADDSNGNHVHESKLDIGAPNGASITFPIFDAFFWASQSDSGWRLSLEKFLKRALDIVGAIAGLILLSPILLLTAILIKATSRGPILFKQTRLGYEGKHFTFLKFRSMYHHCEDRAHQEYVKSLIRGNNGEINNGSHDKPFYKIKNDPRITTVGGLLRKTSIDELPQLWNVLIGDMSLVGPRPPLLYEVQEYQRWHYRRIFEVTPGITGLWQVSGRNRTTFDEMVRLDLFYARNWSLALDIKILFKTVKVLFMPDGV